MKHARSASLLVLALVSAGAGLARADTIYADADDVVVAGPNDTVVYTDGSAGPGGVLPAAPGGDATDPQVAELYRQSLDNAADIAASLDELMAELARLRADAEPSASGGSAPVDPRRQMENRGTFGVGQIGAMNLPGGAW